MSERISKLTEEDLEKQLSIPVIHKKALEHAIYEMSIADDPEDKIWPDYFRAELFNCMQEWELSDDDEVDDHYYTTEAGWFQAGWKAREKAGI